MNSSLFYFTIFLLLMAINNSLAKCPTLPKAPKGFTLSKIMGTWFEIMRDVDPRSTDKCSLQTIMPGESASLRLTTIGLNEKNETVFRTGIAYSKDKHNLHILSVKYPEEYQEIPMAILDIGIDYMLAYSCVDVFGWWEFEEVTLYGRWQSLDMMTGVSVLENAEKNLNRTMPRMRFVDQTKCRRG